MNRAEKADMLEGAILLIRSAESNLDAVWGDEGERRSEPTPYMRVGEAGGLLERARQKLAKAVKMLRKE